MDNKTIVKENWRDFELLAFLAVKKEYCLNDIIKETLTDSIKDGGYDGEFIILSGDNVVQSLFEAKLRSNTGADLPLSDFAKSLIIAVTRFANTIYIVTNLHFSEDTLYKLGLFSERSELEIKLFNGYSVNKFIKSNKELEKSINKELLDFLKKTNKVFAEQHLPIKSLKETNQFDGSTVEEFDRISKIFNKGQYKLLVKGQPYTGKSYYISQLSEYLKNKGYKVLNIDIAKCLTYKDFFVELLSKSFGLTFELIDLLNETSFEQAFQKVGMCNLSENDINTLKFIFSKKDELEFDYAIIFKKLTEFYYNLYRGHPNKKTIFIFQNLSVSAESVLKLLLYIVKNSYSFSCILEITEDEYRIEKSNLWEEIKHHICSIDNIIKPPIEIKKWTKKEAKQYLLENINDLSDLECHQLISKYGPNPKELGDLVEIIKYSELYETCPRDLVFQEVMEIEVNQENLLESKCLKYLQMKNSDVLYIYVFLSILNGEIDKSFLDNLWDSSRFSQCLISLSTSNLFTITNKKITIKSKRSLICLKTYIEKVASNGVIREVIDYIEINKENLSLSTENWLEISVNITYYTEPEECVNELLNLANIYISLEQLTKAREKLELADKIILEENIEIDYVLKFNKTIGFIKTSIWNALQDQRKIETWINSAQKIIKYIDNYEISTYILFLDFYTLSYQYYHAINNTKLALENAKTGVELVEEHNLYDYDLEKCGKIWRFYAIAAKEDTKSIEKCLKIFSSAYSKCVNSAKFQFGYVIHQNMNIKEDDYCKRLNKKLDNYNSLIPLEKDLSIDEYLHYKTNVAALNFNLKKYFIAQKMYKELLDKSAIFCINREEMRILNDMANIEWIHGDLEEAERKYCKALKIAEKAGSIHNYWPILINYSSFQIFIGKYERAVSILNKLEDYIQPICEKVTSKNISFEENEFNRSALIIVLYNLADLYCNFKLENQLKTIQQICEQSKLLDYKRITDVKTIKKSLSLQNTMFEHITNTNQKIYILKD